MNERAAVVLGERTHEVDVDRRPYADRMNHDLAHPIHLLHFREDRAGLRNLPVVRMAVG